ncbi:MAG: hypothetical protein ABW213_16045 [Tardiphaga sp.]
MIKKLAMLAAAGLLYVAVPTASASAQGVSIRLGDRGMHRDHGYRGGRGMHRDYGMRRHGWDRGHRGRTVIIRR